MHEKEQVLRRPPKRTECGFGETDSAIKSPCFFGKVLVKAGKVSLTERYADTGFLRSFRGCFKHSRRDVYTNDIVTALCQLNGVPSCTTTQVQYPRSWCQGKFSLEKVNLLLRARQESFVHVR